MLANFLITIKRDLLIAYRQRSECLNPLVFFSLTTLLFPLAITADPQQLVLMGPGIIWLALLFANMLSIDSLFTVDYDDGTLEQALLNPSSFTLFIIAKLWVHWFTTTVPLVIMSLVLAKLFYLPFSVAGILIITLLLGSPVLTLLGALGSALTLGLKNRGMILFLLVVPLYLPVLIFGAGAVNDAYQNLPIISHLSFLAALLTLAITFMPLTISATVRISLE